MAVSPRPVRCGATLPDGSECQEFATITNAQYVYDRQPDLSGKSDYALKEIHYNAVCPTCGERKLIEPQLGEN
jgi:hypothetical protein